MQTRDQIETASLVLEEITHEGGDWGVKLILSKSYKRNIWEEDNSGRRLSSVTKSRQVCVLMTLSYESHTPPSPRQRAVRSGDVNHNRVTRRKERKICHHRNAVDVSSRETSSYPPPTWSPRPLLTEDQKWISTPEGPPQRTWHVWSAAG